MIPSWVERGYRAENMMDEVNVVYWTRPEIENVFETVTHQQISCYYTEGDYSTGHSHYLFTLVHHGGTGQPRFDDFTAYIREHFTPDPNQLIWRRNGVWDDDGKRLPMTLHVHTKPMTFLIELARIFYAPGLTSDQTVEAMGKVLSLGEEFFWEELRKAERSGREPMFPIPGQDEDDD